jgi:hypothetical protein
MAAHLAAGPRHCLYCGAVLEPPRPRSTVLAKFCPGSRCRSGWHAARRRERIRQAQELLGVVEALLRELAR